MISVAAEEFSRHHGKFLSTVQEEPVTITSQEGGHRAVLVSQRFFERAMEALEDQEDLIALEKARFEPTIPWEALKRELGH